MYFLLTTAAVIAYYIYMVMRKPEDWLHYIHLLPVIVFMTYARLYGMQENAWDGAFQLAGLVAAIVIVILWQHHVVMDRIMLGINLFLIVGAIGFLLNNDTILDWYGSTKGGPLFCAVAIVGIITTMFSSRGFIGVVAKKRELVVYSSLLLLAATFIALVWSVSAESQGIFWAIVVPFILLKVMREKLIEHLL